MEYYTLIKVKNHNGKGLISCIYRPIKNLAFIKFLNFGIKKLIVDTVSYDLIKLCSRAKLQIRCKRLKQNWAFNAIHLRYSSEFNLPIFQKYFEF